MTMMPTFTAIDFETAQPKRWSICQVGLVRVEAGIGLLRAGAAGVCEAVHLQTT